MVLGECIISGPLRILMSVHIQCAVWGALSIMRHVINLREKLQYFGYTRRISSIFGHSHMAWCQNWGPFAVPPVEDPVLRGTGKGTLAVTTHHMW